MKNMFLGCEKKGRFGFLNDDKAMYEETKRSLRLINLNIDPKTLIKDISIGTQQMVEIAKAISKNSKVLVFDEPTSSLTDAEKKELFRIILMLKEQGVGMFYISHRLEEVQEIGDRVSIMRDGSLISTNNVHDLSMEQMIEQIAGRKIENLYPHTRQKKGELILNVKNCTGKGFKDISLQVNKGEIVGLSGLMGAGRTELVRAIFGIDDYQSGEISLCGHKIIKKNPKKSVCAGMGLLPEERKTQGLALQMSIRENMVASVLSDMHISGIIKISREKKACQKYVKKLSIATPSIEKTVGFLSGGTQQKVVIAKWLLANLRLFIFDEPTRGIDVGAKSEIYKLMDDLVSQGAAILMISSDLPEILGMSDRIYVMSQGKIRGEIDSSQADQYKLLQLAYQQS